MGHRDNAQQLQAELVELRHALHRHPEIGLHLPHTQRAVLAALDDLPLEISTGSALSSVTAVLRGAHPGPTVLLRGDMDALPITERTGVPYASQMEGAMHACGHDLHVTMLVGAARLLSGLREQLHGDVVFMFQPGEEGYDGAGHMLREGVLSASGTAPVAAYALHVSPRLPAGTFTTRSGPFLAASDRVNVVVKGRGGHGALPHLSADPVPAASALVSALHSIVPRAHSPFDPVILTVGQINAGTAHNVIGDRATLSATIRTFTDETRALVRATVQRVCEGIALAHDLTIEIDHIEEYPPTLNNPAEVDRIRDMVEEVFGAERFIEMVDPLPGSEDFSRILAEVPGVMAFVGTDEGFTDNGPGHSADVIFGDSVLSQGATWFAEAVTRRLAPTSHRAGNPVPASTTTASAQEESR